MQIPEELAKLAQKRMEGNNVEGFVYGSGPEKPKLMLVGEAPGETEVETGIPFCGRAGQKLMDFLEGLGLTREDVYITSAVRSRPYVWKEKTNRKGMLEKRKYNRPPTAKEIVAHAPVLDYELKHVEAPIIVTLGNIGLQRLLGKKVKITDVHGQFLKQSVQCLNDDDHFGWTNKEYLLFPTFHPASVFYNPKLREDVAHDQLILKNWLQTQ